MAERYTEGTPQPDLDADAWVEAAGVPRKGRVYGFGDSLDTHRVLSSYASLIAPPAHASSSSAPPVSGIEDIRGIIREELQVVELTVETASADPSEAECVGIRKSFMGNPPFSPEKQWYSSLNDLSAEDKGELTS
ncbi:hypothetical protein Taro_047640 [Colocasia esculenta]|uniref:Uncharacterized protein n=1 Tax=Colocasia esculenta TaxID=4460 RepID=A0A843X6U8_COLES|nr:hypothetical protein [Colocasia esculenta]